MSKEYLDIVDRDNRVIGRALRGDCHGNPHLIHRAVHVFVKNDRDEIYLQKRSVNKDIQPGKWDSSVGGHLNSGEAYIDAAYRETHEELGIVLESPVFLHEYLYTNDIESEWIQTFIYYYNGPFSHCREEIDDGRFWSADEILKADPGIFTLNLLKELKDFPVLPRPVQLFDSFTLQKECRYE